MKRWQIAVCVILALLTGCARPAQTQRTECVSHNEKPGKTRTIVYVHDGTNVLQIHEEMTYDTEYDEGMTVEAYVTEMMRTLPFYNESVNGVRYEMESVGKVVTVRLDLDLTEAAKPVVSKFDFLPESILRGDDAGYVMREEDFRNYLESELFKSACELKPEK